MAYDRTEHMYLIKYYDGDVEWISLQHHACRRLEHLPKGADSVLLFAIEVSNITTYLMRNIADDDWCGTHQQSSL